MNNYILHVGVGHLDNPPGRGSGRFAYGSGDNPYQHQHTFKSKVDQLRREGLSDGEIAKILIGEHARAEDVKIKITIENEMARKSIRAKCLTLYDECNGNVSEVARRLNINESSVRSYLDPVLAERHERYENTAEFLRDKIANTPSGVIDVGKETELYFGIPGVSENTKKVAIKMLEEEGYTYTTVKIPQAGTAFETTVKVLADPSLSWSDIQKRKYEIGSVTEFTPDEGKTFWTPEYPSSFDSKRVYIRYGDEGGKDKDGTIELRRGVDEISLDGPLYSQVRIAVDDKYYMKGMAVYSDDIPEGYDVVYNTNKKRGAIIFPEKSTDSAVYKKLKDDPDNPFGATIKAGTEKDGEITRGGQHYYISETGEKKLSPINKIADEGDWNNWSKNLSSQFLSKQDVKLIERQLYLTTLDKKAELESIRALTNPVIKQSLLEDFAAQCDSNASTLAAKGFKGSAFQVLIPVTSLKDNEIYAPNYKDGEQVALIRYPHGGVFEIPVLTVNNKNPEGKKTLGKNAQDAVGINAHNAEILSGADFDGDTALVIPLTTNNIKIKYAPPLKELENFDHKALYSLPKDAPVVKNSTKQTEMGKVTNLITDMTVASASTSEIAKAVKHSMVVIDSEKHHLDYKQSEKDNDIDALKRKYQGVTAKGNAKGASTILSRASAEIYIDERKEVTRLSSMTEEQQKAYKAGKKVYVPTEKTVKERREITDPKKMDADELKRYNEGKRVFRETGKTKNKQQTITQMDYVDDAMDLVRDKTNKKEVAYANFANELKSLANEARSEARSMEFTKASRSAKEVYASEVKSLDEKLRIAKSNSPKERQAQVIANAKCNEKFKNNTTGIEWDYEHKQRERARALEQARAQVGAKKELINITDKEWEAIQANAVSTKKLKEIIINTDQDKFKQRATPKGNQNLSERQKQLIMQMVSTGQYTNKEIAERLGISASTVSKVVNE